MFEVEDKGEDFKDNWFVENITNGFVKKTQKTSKADSDLARKYKSDYERRYCHE